MAEPIIGVVIPERYWRPVAGVIWSLTGRVVIGLVLLAYCVARFGLIGTARGFGQAAIFVAIALVIERAWRRRPRRRRAA